MLMRKSIASLALITREKDGVREWLARWNRHWEAFHFVGGGKHESESFRECCIREIGEELGLKESTGFSVSDAPLECLEFTAWSKRAGEETDYKFEVFDVEIHAGAASDRVSGDPQIRWLSRKEIAAGMTTDGKEVSETVERIVSCLE
jgi:8-oxo-dGTP pyrophosphatase MutT (NUDIX family)